MDEHLQALEQFQRTAIDLTVHFGPRLLAAVLIFAVGVIASRWVGRIMAPALHKFELEPPVRDLLGRIARVLVMGLFAVMALQNLGVELLPLIAGLGIAGAGIALAPQGVLGNLAAGLTIIFTRPFKVGEYVSIVGVEGCVESVGLFNTTLSHPDRSKVVVPNRKMSGEILHNYGKIRQLHISVRVAYHTDLPLAIRAIREVLEANQRVLVDPEPSGGHWHARRLRHRGPRGALDRRGGPQHSIRRDPAKHRRSLPRTRHRDPLSAEGSACHWCGDLRID
jgi:small conductance mechanosensitive channel